MDPEALCSSTVKEAKVTCIQTIKEAKATHACTIWVAKTTCSAAIRDAKTQGPLRPNHSTGNMPKPSKTWRNKSSKRKAEAKLTSSPPVRLPYTPAIVEFKGMLVASYHILMGQAPTSHPFTLSQGASPAEEPSASAAPPMPVPEQSPRLKRWHPSPDPADNMPLGRTTSKATSEGPLAPNGEKSHLGTRYSSRAT